MPPKLEKAIRDAQIRFERDTDKARALRQQTFREAHKAGMSHSQIAKAAGLHKSRIGQILAG